MYTSLQSVADSSGGTSNFNTRLHRNVIRTEALLRTAALRPYWLSYQIRALVNNDWPAFIGCRSRKRVALVLLELMRHTWRWRCLPFHYFRYRLYENSVTREDADRILPETVFFYQMLPRVNTACLLLDDKVISKSILASKGVPQPATVLTKAAGALWDSRQRRVSDAKVLVDVLATGPDALVLKPASFSSGGRDVTVFGRVDGRHVSGGGVALDWKLLMALPGKWLVEECLEQPGWLRELHPESLNTFRVVTVWTGSGPVVVSCVLKCGAAGEAAANFHRSGVAVAVDLGTGVLASEGVDLRLRRFRTHPTTGVRFEGIRVREVDAICSTAIASAEALPELAVVGWDLALNEAGVPVVLEGNSSPGLDITQLTEGGVAQLLASLIGRPR
jgi:hypothetical protein